MDDLIAKLSELTEHVKRLSAFTQLRFELELARRGLELHDPATSVESGATGLDLALSDLDEARRGFKQFVSARASEEGGNGE